MKSIAKYSRFLRIYSQREKEGIALLKRTSNILVSWKVGKEFSKGI
jgi:hypothetical protein